MSIPLYKKAFPDFGDLDVQIPDGFKDISWKNDVCPSFLDEENGIRIWVDYLDSDMREIDGRPRFLVQNYDIIEGESKETLLETDDFDAVRNCISEYVQSFDLPKGPKI